MWSEQQLVEMFIQYSHQPFLLYSAIFFFSFISAIGFPFPEELLIITAGLAAHVSMHPELYPNTAGSGVTLFSVTLVTFLAIFLSDILIFSVGKFLGPKIKHTKLFNRLVPDKALNKVQVWMKKYGFWTAGIFRFTPGLRFTGFFSCGMLGVSMKRFIFVDGVAALIWVPTQVILIGTYGEVILEALKHFRTGLLVVAACAMVFLIVKWLKRRRAKRINAAA